MRLLQLNPNGNEASVLDFHPMLTVVNGLSAEGRRRVIDAVTGLPRGEAPELHGLVEAYGILFDLSDETLRLFDLAHEAGIEVVVRAADLPGAGAGSLPTSLQPLDVDDFIAVTPRGTYPDLDALRDRLDQAAEATGLLRVAAERAREAHQDAVERARAAEEALDRATRAPRANLRLVTDEFEPEAAPAAEPAAAAQLDADDFDEDRGSLDADLTDLFDLSDDDDSSLRSQERQAFAPGGLLGGARPQDDLSTALDEGDERDEVGELADAEDTYGSGGPGGSFGDDTSSTAADQGETPPERRARLEQRRVELEAVIERVDRGIDELAALDARPVQVLVEAIKNPGPVEYVPSERGNELADEFVRLQGEVAVLEEGLAARGMDTPSAMAQLDAAKIELAKAEKAMRPPEYTDADRAELEAAHDEVLEAESKARGRGGKKRLEEAMAKERVVLDRMGFPTWSAYVMGAGLMGIDPLAEQRLDKARAEYERAEQHWSDVTAMIEADPVHRDLLDRLEGLYLEAFDLLGGDDETEDLESKLRNLQEPKREVSEAELLEALVYQLELLGITLPADMQVTDRVLMVSEAFLEEASGVIDRLNELGDEKIAALTEMNELDEELAALPTVEEWEAQEEARRAEAEAEAAAEAEAEAAAEAEAEAAAAEAEAEAEAAAAEAEAEAEAEDDAGTALSDEELAELEREFEIATEDEGEYAELVEAREALLEAAEQVESVAASRLRARAAELAGQEAGEGATAVPAGSDVPDTDAAFADVGDVDAGAESVEFYLLSRLAALKSVSYAGSVPLVLDDALAGLPRDAVEQVLGKLERMAESVQIIYLTDDAAVSEWAERVGFEHAAVVTAPPTFA